MASLGQPQVSRIETGRQIRHLDTLRHWARVLRIPPTLLWFRLSAGEGQRAATESAASDLVVPVSNGALDSPAGPASSGGQPGADTSGEHTDDPEHDPVLVAPWNHRGTVEAVVVLSGGGRVERRVFLSLTGPALTAPAHQWLIHEPEPLVSGLAGRRVPPGVVDRLPAMIAELRAMDDMGAET
jgi:hypothetical protein